MDYRRVRQCAQKQTETVGLVHSLDILIRHAVWLFGQDDPAPPPHPIFSSDFGNSHDPAGLGLGDTCPSPWLRYCSRLLLLMAQAPAISRPTHGRFSHDRVY